MLVVLGWVQFFSNCNGLGWVSQLMGWAGLGHLKWTHGQLCAYIVRIPSNHTIHDGTGVNPAGDAGDTSPPIFFVGGDVNGNIPPQYNYVLSDIADQYWLPSVRSASSRFHSAIRRHQFALVRQADSRLTRLVPPNLELALTPLLLWTVGTTVMVRCTQQMIQI